MRKVIFSLIGITAAFTFILNSSHATDTQKALSEEKLYNMLTTILADDKNKGLHFIVRTFIFIWGSLL